MKKILLNASQKEEVRLAVIEDNKLIDLDIDFPSRNIKSNIYKGTISRVEPSLEAAFINFGRTRHGFLPFKEIAPEIFSHTNKSSRDCLQSGKEIIVQVDKEERGNKGAALTTYLSLAGKYLVLLPKNPSTGGISRRIEGEDRVKAKKLMESLEVPEGMSVILRTSSLEASNESVKWDIEYLIQIYESVLETSIQQTAPFLIYQESSMMAFKKKLEFYNQISGEFGGWHTNIDTNSFLYHMSTNDALSMSDGEIVDLAKKWNVRDKKEIRGGIFLYADHLEIIIFMI